MFLGMDPAFGMTDEWSFQVNAKRHGATTGRLFFCDPGAQGIQGLEQAVFGRGYGGRKITGHAGTDQVRLHGRKRFGAGFHHVVSRAAVYMDVNQSGSKRHSGKVQMTAGTRELGIAQGASGDHAAILHREKRRFDFLARSEQTGRSQYRFHDCYSAWPEERRL